MQALVSIAISSLLLLFTSSELRARPSIAPGYHIRTNNQKIVLIGDIHGDLNALVRILEGQGLINRQGDWIGEDSVLIFMGDLINRGPDSRGVMDLVMKLQSQAATRRGRVEALIGNHELMVAQGDFRFVRAAETRSFEDLGTNGRMGREVAYQGPSVYAEWIRSRPTILQVSPSRGPSLMLVHGGLGYWALSHHPDQVNQHMRNWLSYYQGLGPKPADETSFVIDQDYGPAWNRYLVEDGIDALEVTNRHFDEPQQLSREELAGLLRSYSAEYLVVAHTPTQLLTGRNTIMRQTTRMGEFVTNIDTGIGTYYGGRLSAYVYQEGRWRAHYYDRPEELHPLVLDFRQACRNALKDSIRSRPH